MLTGEAYFHKIVLSIYGDFSEGGTTPTRRIPKKRVANAAIECMDCNVVLLDFDNPKFECSPDLQKKRIKAMEKK